MSQLLNTEHKYYKSFPVAIDKTFQIRMDIISMFQLRSSKTIYIYLLKALILFISTKLLHVFSVLVWIFYKLRDVKGQSH